VLKIESLNLCVRRPEDVFHLCRHQETLRSGAAADTPILAVELCAGLAKKWCDPPECEHVHANDAGLYCAECSRAVASARALRPSTRARGGVGAL